MSLPLRQELFGKKGSSQRLAFIAESEKRLDIEFNDDQRKVLLEWSWRILLLKCAPGAGKTTLLEAMTMRVLTSGPMYKLRIMVTSNFHVDNTFDRIQDACAKANIEAKVSRIGFSQSSKTYHIEDAQLYHNMCSK